MAGIPAFNEEKTIAKVIINAQKHVDIVVVCDDGSQDMTPEIAQKLGATVIKHEKNLGYGAALRTLFEKARMLNADMLLTLDADGQHNTKDIPNLIEPILANKADIVIGSRFLQQKSSIPLYRRLGIKTITKMTNGSKENATITDAQCGLRAYSQRAIERLRIEEQGMGASAEILLKAKEAGLVVVEVPAEVTYTGLETSTQNPITHGLDVITAIIRTIVEERPLFYLGIPGAVFLLFGIGFGLWALQIYATSRYLETNVALVSFAFGLIGAFAIFTAITLYAIGRLTRKLSSRNV